MTAWLASIVGVVVVGVVVELVTQGRRMENFVRSIYSFVVLFVIVSPLPKLLQTDWDTIQMENLVDAELVENLLQSSKQVQVSQILRNMGYENALVTLVDDTVYVNLGLSLETEKLQELQKTLGEEVVII